MTLKLFSCLSAQRKALGPAPPPAGFCESRIWQAAEAGNWGALQGLRDALVEGVNPEDHIGFEDAARPLYIDPMAGERLRRDYPMLWPLRERGLQERKAWRLPVPPAGLAAYEAMRAACGEPERRQLADWLCRIDAAVPRDQKYITSDVRRAQLEPVFTAALPAIRNSGIFKQIPDLLWALDRWPWGNSFILRGAWFTEFATSCFEAMMAASTALPVFCRPFLCERLLGVYLRHKILRDPLVRIAELKLLYVLPELPPRWLPPGFDAATYYRLNPDVLAAGLDARAHYLHYGWHEDRDWNWP